MPAIFLEVIGDEIQKLTYLLIFNWIDRIVTSISTAGRQWL